MPIIYFISSCVIMMLVLIKLKLNRQHLYKLAAKVPILEGTRMLPFIGHGGYLTGGLEIPIWKKHRKAINPIFNSRNLSVFAEIFSKKADIFVEVLENKTGQLIDIYQYALNYGIETVCETLFGLSIDAQSTETNVGPAILRFLHALAHCASFETDTFVKFMFDYRAMEILLIRASTIPYHYDWIFKFTKLYREEHKCADIVRNFILNMVEKKLTEYKTKVVKNNNINKSDHLTLLETLSQQMENGENWTIEEMRNEASVLLIGGSDTSATITSFAMILLGMHPEIQQKCYEEIIEVMASKRQLEQLDLPKLINVENVIKETMRLFPVAPVLFRKVDEDIDVGGYTLPKGAGLILYVLTTHYSELYYKDPWKFDPDRFSPEETAKRHKYAYVPFSAGPRNCIGLKFAMISMKTIIATTLRKYRIETTYRSIKDIKTSISIKSLDGFPVKLFLRN